MSVFGSISKAWDQSIGKAGKTVAKVLPSPIRKIVRYAPIPLVVGASGGFLPLPMVRKTFGLNANEAKYTEMGLKGARVVTTAIGATVGAAYLAGPSSTAGVKLTAGQRASVGLSILKTKLGVGTATDLVIAKEAAIPASAYAAGPNAIASFGPGGVSHTAAGFGSQSSGALALVNPATPTGLVSYGARLGTGKDFLAAAASTGKTAAPSKFWDLTASALLGSALNKSFGAVGMTPPAFMVQSPDQTAGSKSSAPLDLSAGGSSITNAPSTQSGGDGGGDSILAGFSPWIAFALVGVAAAMLLRKKK